MSHWNGKRLVGLCLFCLAPMTAVGCSLFSSLDGYGEQVASTDAGTDAHDASEAAPPTTCTPGEHRCEENVLLTCNADGSDWQKQACETYMTCDATSGACVCVPGSAICDKSVLHVCQPDGLTWNEQTCEGKTPVCDEESGACRACKLGETVCDGNVLKECATDGTGWKETVCEGDTDTCDATLAKCLVCHPGQTFCAPGELHTCSPDGSKWTATPCDSDDEPLCEPSLGKCVACAPGSSYGEGDTLHVCQKDGTYATKKCSSPALVNGAGGECATVKTKVKQISLGYQFGCALLEGKGDVRCWGDNQKFAVAPVPDGNPWDDRVGFAYAVPQQVTTDASYISAGRTHACAVIGQDGHVACWGYNDHGEVGASPSDEYPGLTKVQGLTGIKQVGAGRDASCALASDGTISCWGSCASGVVFSCATGDRNYPAHNNTWPVSGTPTKLALAKSGSLACVLLSTHSVVCWGQSVVHPARVTINAMDIAVDDGYVYALQSNGSVNRYKIQKKTPSEWTIVQKTALLQVLGATEMGAGNGFCAVRTDGTLNCDADGKFGTQSKDVDRFNGTICALTKLGTVRCVGDPWRGQLGNGRPVLPPVPTRLDNLSGVVEMYPGSQSTSIGRLLDGTTVGWGDGLTLFSAPFATSPKDIPVCGDKTTFVAASGQLFPTPKSYAYRVQGDSLIFRSMISDHVHARLGILDTTPYVSAYMTPSFDIGLRRDGSVAVYSTSSHSNDEGILGNNGQATQAGAASVVPDLSNVVGFAARTWNAKHACVWHKDGHATCWGRSDDGQTGTGAGFGTDVLTPTSVKLPDGVKVTQMSVSLNHTCAVTAQGSVYCWGGGGHGALGDGHGARRKIPTKVEAITNARQVVTGHYHSCALLDSGKVRCWGSNYYGQLGDGTMVSSQIPVDVKGLDNATGLVASGSGTCGWTKTGTVLCWGVGPGNDGLARGSTQKEPQLVVGLND